MRFVLLNIMLLGMAFSIVGGDVFAKDLTVQKQDYFEDFVYEKPQLSKSFRSAVKSAQAVKKFQRRKKVARTNKPIDTQTEEESESVNSSKSKIPPAPPLPFIPGGNANIPPPPPPPSISGNVPPPPPPLLGMAQSISFAGEQKKKVDISVVMKNLRTELDEFLEESGITMMANVVNLYLQGNKEKISEGISAAEISMTRLDKRLDSDLEELNKASADSEITSEFVKILSGLKTPLKKLTAKGYRAEDPDKSKTFREISQEIQNIAYKYFQKVMDSGDDLKKVPNLKALKDAEIVLERAVVLSNSFSNLVDLSEQPRNEEFFERSTQDAILLVNLKRFISDKLRESSSTSSKVFITLPTGTDVVEKEYLEKALQYIDETCKGNDQLQKLLDMRDILNNKYTIITSNDQTDNRRDPVMIIRQLDDRVAEIGDLLKQASRKSGDNYSQFGKMFTEGDTGYGGALIASVNQWINSNDFSEFSNDKIRNSFKVVITGDAIAEYLRLLSVDMNLCPSFAKTTISRITSQAKFKASSYVSVSKQTETKKEEKKVLLEITNGQAKLGTSSDPKKDKNLIPFSMLKKNCEEYVKEISSAVEEVREVPRVLSKIKKSFAQEISGEHLAAYINSILNGYFVFKDFSPQGDQVSFSVINTEKGLLSTADTPNVVFALAQNCNLALKQPALPLFPTSKDTNNTWVLKMASDLHTVISEIIATISEVKEEISAEQEEIDQTELEATVSKLRNLAISLQNAIDQSFQSLKISISDIEKEIFSRENQMDADVFAELTNKVRKAKKSVNQLNNMYAKTHRIDDVELGETINQLQEIYAEIRETVEPKQTKLSKIKSATKQIRRKRTDELTR